MRLRVRLYREGSGHQTTVGPGEVGSYVTSLQFLLCQQYIHRRECMGKNKDVARTKQTRVRAVLLVNKVYLRQNTAYSRRTPSVSHYTGPEPAIVSWCGQCKFSSNRAL